MYVNERIPDYMETANYFAFPGLIDKMSFVVGKKDTKAVNPEKIIMKVCEHFGQPSYKVKGRSRKTELVRPRHFCFVLLHKKFKMDCTEVGRVFGVDHATVLNGCKSIQNKLDINDRFYMKDLNELLRKVS